MRDLCMTLDHPYVGRVREAAKKANVNVILPLMEKDGDLMYNSLVPVTAAGELLRPFRKMFPVGGGSLDAESPGDNNEAQIVVTDAGRGMEPEELAHAFEPFWRGSEGATGGSGLGLHLVRELTATHGGVVSAESAGRDAGSVFRVRLPRRGRQVR